MGSSLADQSLARRRSPTRRLSVNWRFYMGRVLAINPAGEGSYSSVVFMARLLERSQLRAI